MKSKKGTIIFVVVVAAVLLGAWLFMGGADAEHIEDTNGPEDISLASITQEDILGNGVHTSVGGPYTEKHTVSYGGVTMSDGTRFYSEKFSGICEIDNGTLLSGSDLAIYLYDFSVTAGNFQIFVVLDGVIVGTIEPDSFATFEMLDTDGGYYQVFLAGESAAFEFTSFEIEA
ncbi:MAG: hypothetical protein IJ491_07815 [Clostridia bacterium]|nr:hypothetical protein [Clostridia bacterium]